MEHSFCKSYKVTIMSEKQARFLHMHSVLPPLIFSDFKHLVLVYCILVYCVNQSLVTIVTNPKSRRGYVFSKDSNNMRVVQYGNVYKISYHGTFSTVKMLGVLIIGLPES